MLVVPLDSTRAHLQILDCAQNCAHSAFRQQIELRPQKDEHTVWTCLPSCALLCALESTRRSQIRRVVSKRYAAANRARTATPCCS
jgi:hypothetical protein